MKPYVLHHGDCIEVMRGMADASVDSIVTDPPYELGFMGKSWDASGIAYNVGMWREALRVLKPGGHLLAFSGSRTYHRMTCAIEDAGFEIRDQIMWVYGSGFPKSLDVSKAIYKAAGARGHDSTRFNAVGQQGERTTGGDKFRGDHPDYVKPKGITPEAQHWEGWGTALKPAHEPICVARKPLAAGTVAANVLQFGTGALNIEGCRVKHVTVGDGNLALNPHLRTHIHGGNGGNVIAHEAERRVVTPNAAGRWPANLIHDGSDEVLALFPESTSGAMKASTQRAAQDAPGSVCFGTYGGAVASADIQASSGSAARFFYCAKASRADRNEGLPSSSTPAVATDATMRECERADWSTRNGNHHPTVKPTDLMAYLVRMVTPPGGTVLDPFMGSGSTGKAAMREGFRFVGIDMTPEYIEIATARIEHELAKSQAAASVAAEKKAAANPAQLTIFDALDSDEHQQPKTAIEATNA